MKIKNLSFFLVSLLLMFNCSGDYVNHQINDENLLGCPSRYQRNQKKEQKDQQSKTSQLFNKVNKKLPLKILILY